MSKTLTFQNRTMLTAMAGGALPLVVAIVLTYQSGTPPGLALLVSVALLGSWLWLGYSVRDQVCEPMRALANMLEALREGDYMLRGRSGAAGDVLSDVYGEVNALSGYLVHRRGRRIESAALVDKLMETVDVAIMTFDAAGGLINMNRFAEELVSENARAETLNARNLGLEALLVPGTTRAVSGLLGASDRRWQVSCQSFRERGQAHHLLVASDVSTTLRDEELNAWRRLIRVISHELNNSLTPIRTLSESMLKQLANQPVHVTNPLRDSLRRALELIATRANGLARFVSRYAELARLPAPVLGPTDLSGLIGRVCRLERVSAGGNWESAAQSAPALQADTVQLEQALINLVRNAKDAIVQRQANDETCIGNIQINLLVATPWLDIEIADNGVGVRSIENLFVPFFTTKPEGSGIGLVLTRQILESHGGTLTLANNPAGNGCIASMRLPLSTPNRQSIESP